MAILYGTQSNGETLPVLVDQFGNLLAKGIDGAPGTPGTPGEPGPPGTPGVGELPPDPYEGALLGWLNNELAWIGTPPVPIADGVFGPITAWDPAGLLTVDGEIPQQIKQGVYVYQCNPDGSIFVDGWNTSEIWSSYAVNLTNPNLAFDGKLETGQNGSATGIGSKAECSFTFACEVTSTIEIHCRGFMSSNAWLYVGDTEIGPLNAPGDGYFWEQVNYQGTIGPANPLRIVNRESSKSFQFNGVRVDGTALIDAGEYPSAPNLNFRVNTVNGQNLIGVPNRTDNFTIGKYLRVPQQNVARWLYDGNLSKVITSTGIDISRLTGI